MMLVCLHMPVGAGFLLCAQAADQMLKDGKAPADIHGKALYDQAIKGRFVGAQAPARARARVVLCVRIHSTTQSATCARGLSHIWASSTFAPRRSCSGHRLCSSRRRVPGESGCYAMRCRGK